MKKINLIGLTLLVIICLISGCKFVKSSPYKEISGAWKSTEISKIDKKPYCFSFSENEASINGNTVKGIKYSKENGIISAINSKGYAFIKITLLSDTEIEIENHAIGRKHLTKTTMEDISSILNAPSPSELNKPLPLTSN